jgi:hypothetical protein
MATSAEALAELERLMPGAMAAMEPGPLGMHTPDSIDHLLVVSGEVTLELDDGALTLLRAGDVVVQNGTRHAWRNHGTGPCTVVGVAIGRIVPRLDTGLERMFEYRGRAWWGKHQARCPCPLPLPVALPVAIVDPSTWWSPE